MRRRVGRVWSDAAADRQGVSLRSSSAGCECVRVTDRGVGTTAWSEAVGGGFFKTSLRVRQGSSIESHQRWREGNYRAIEASLSVEGEGLTVTEQCQTAEVSRAGFYRYLHQAQPKQADMLLRARLQS